MNQVNDINELRMVIGVDVSRETIRKLEKYLEILLKWNPKINLVSKHTIDHAWKRHFVDSAQLLQHAPNFQKWVDIGSGAGFPGMVIAILAAELYPESEIHLIESDQRKCAFLRNVSRETSVRPIIHNCRIEDFEGTGFDIVSARALASVDLLLHLSEKLLSRQGKCLFLKGRQCDTELTEAQKTWRFECDKIPGSTEDDGIIVRIGGLTRVEQH
jgi:16S rRNA (guanine527-N7)-methyltransferase